MWLNLYCISHSKAVVAAGDQKIIWGFAIWVFPWWTALEALFAAKHLHSESYGI